MITGRVGDVTPAEILEKGVKGVGMKVLISETNGAPNFVMRIFEIEPGGHTPYHTHDWEHEIFVVDGKGALKQGDVEHPLEKDSFALVVPGEEHQFINKGEDAFRFICVVPKL